MINNDPLFALINQEQQRQQQSLELIASENFASPAVLAAQGSVLTNKYAEGYYQHRYYGGCKFIDEVEMLAITRARTAALRHQPTRQKSPTDEKLDTNADAAAGYATLARRS